MLPITLTVFSQQQRIAHGTIIEVIDKLLSQGSSLAPYLVFNDNNGKTIDLHLRGTPQTIYEQTIATYPELAQPVKPLQTNADTPRSRGRPKLGVVAKEVTLLPRHWEWLATQPVSASATLRRLVDEARKNNVTHDEQKKLRERTYQFMMAVAGNLPLYEEALRALFASDKVALSQCIATWPSDVRNYIEKLNAPI